MRRPWLWILVGTGLHFLLSVGSFLWSYVISSSHFDGHAVSHVEVLFARMLTAITWFPFARPMMDAFPLSGIVGWLPVLANSALCVLVLVGLARWIGTWMRRGSSASPGGASEAAAGGER